MRELEMTTRRRKNLSPSGRHWYPNGYNSFGSGHSVGSKKSELKNVVDQIRTLVHDASIEGTSEALNNALTKINVSYWPIIQKVANKHNLGVDLSTFKSSLSMIVNVTTNQKSLDELGLIESAYDAKTSLEKAIRRISK